MLIDQIFRAASAHKNQFTANEIAAELEVARDEVSKGLKALKEVGAASNDGGTWTLTCRRTDARDHLVRAALGRSPRASRAELNESLSGHSAAQVYTSLQRLILRGYAVQERDGSRTPRYSLTEEVAAVRDAA